MIHIYEFDEYRNAKSDTRTKRLNEDIFLDLLKKECKNYSPNNSQLWRNTNKSFGDFGIFFESDRRGTIGDYNYKDFFNLRREYPVPRYKSLIGSTSKEGAKYFGSNDQIYLVIPFDNAQIVFAGVPDLGIWHHRKQVYSDDLFILSHYEKDFKYLEKELKNILLKSSASSYADKFDEKNLGFEFFTNSNCLLIHESKINWLNEIFEKF
jgi:hypothetical protein